MGGLLFEAVETISGNHNEDGAQRSQSRHQPPRCHRNAFADIAAPNGLNPPHDKRDVHYNRELAWHRRQPLGAFAASQQFFFHHVLEDLVVERQLGKHLLQPPILFLELTDPLEV